MKECTTHHHACDCRERAFLEIIQLVYQLVEDNAFDDQWEEFEKRLQDMYGTSKLSELRKTDANNAEKQDYPCPECETGVARKVIVNYPHTKPDGTKCIAYGVTIFLCDRCGQKLIPAKTLEILEQLEEYPVEQSQLPNAE